MHSRVENIKNMMIGKEFQTKRKGKCFIIDYKGYNNVLVKFYEPSCEVSCQMQALKNGNVSNPLYPSVYKNGFIGIGEYSSKDEGLYCLWKSMLLRSYDDKYHEKYPTYKDVEVCDEWLNFQNFADWCSKQKFFNAKDAKERPYHLDKDIVVKGSKIYSPNTCSFVPSEVNTLLLKRGKSRGVCLIGVSKHEPTGSYLANVKHSGRNVHLGSYCTENEAFQAYKLAKEAYIKEVAEKWRGKIDDKVYQALLTYQVETTD